MKKVCILAFLMMFSVPGLVYAEDSPDVGIQENYSAYSLGEVVVSASREGAEAGNTIHRITAAEIKDSGARTLDEVLDLVPGVYVRIGGSGTPRIDIRGFRTRHVNLLLDGIPYNNTYDGQFEPTTIPVENIAEIKVITGGSSVLYGPGGNGGTINIITKKGTKGTHGTITGELGEEDAKLGRFTFSAVGDKLDTFISGSMTDKDGFPLSDDFDETDSENGGLRENSDAERQNIALNFGYTPGDTTQIGFSYNHFSGENGVPSIVNPKVDSFAKKAKYERVDDIDGEAVQLALDHQFNNPFKIRGWAYYSQVDLEENAYKDDTYSTVKDAIDSTSEISGINLHLSYDFKNSGIATVGVTTENQKWDANGYDSKTNKVYSVALEYGVSPMERLDLLLGYGYHDFDKDGGKDEDGYSYVIGADFRVMQDTWLKASHARKIRFPSIKQLYDPKSGNEDLEAETTKHFELGVMQRFFENTDVSLTAFRIDAEDFIEKIGDGDSTNYEEYLFKGIEFSVDTQPCDGLRVRLAYSYLDSEDQSEGSLRDELQHRPEKKYTVEVTYRFPFGLTLYSDVLRVVDQYFYNDDDPFLKKELGDFTVVNLKLAQKFFKKALEVYLGSDNILDEDYEQSYGLPQAGRTIYGGLTYSF